MATRYWTAETSADWNVTTNWTDDTVPVDGDTVIFDGRTATPPSSNLTQGAIDLAGLYYRSSYTGGIGAAGTPLEIEVSGDLLIEGTGSYYIQSAAADTTTSGAIDRTIINTTGNVYLSSMNNDGALGYITSFVDLIINSGTVVIYGDADKATTGAESGTVISSLYLAPTSGKGGGVSVTVGDLCYAISAATTMNVYMDGGSLSMSSALATVRQHGGTFTWGDTGYSMGASDDSMTALHLYGGTFKFQPSVVSASVRTTATAAPAITTAHLYGGTFDASGMLEYITTAPTITTTYLYEGALMNLDNGYGQFVLTTLKDYGGTISKTSGQALTLS